MRPRIVLAVAVFAAAIGALYWSQAHGEPAIVSGFVEADEIRVGSRVGGRVAEVLVAEGAPVKAGATLVRLEPYNLKEALAQAEAEWAAASAVRDKLAAGFRPEEVAQAEAMREQASAAYQEAKAGPRKQEIDEAADSLKLAEATLELAAATHRRVENLFGTKAASREEFDRATSERKVAAASAEVARSKLEMLKEGTRAEQIEQARARLLGADAELELRRRGFRKEEIAEAEARASAAKALVRSIQTQLAELDIRAPIDSVVEAIDLRPGDLIAPNAPVVSLMDVGHLWVRTYVPESRLGAARPDRKLSIRVDGFPDQVFQGRVSYVSRQAEFTPSNVQTPEERSKQVFRIKVELEEGLDVLRPGMIADVWLSEVQGP